MNDYDKAGRYLIKRDPPGFFRWLLESPSVDFRAWIDARRIALPNQNDLTNDLVAALSTGKVLEAICLELEAAARADALTRLLAYLARAWTEPGGADSLEVACVSGAIVDLTGRSPNRKLTLESQLAPGCRLEIVVLRRTLMDESAAQLVADVATGKLSPWLLGWVPLMHGGNESDIILQWRAAAETYLTDTIHRSDLGLLTMVFATHAERRPAWEKGLKGWNMITSPIFDEFRAKIREEIHAEVLAVGREEGREEGREREARALLLRLGRQKFGKPPTKRQQKTLEETADLARLESLADRLLTANSWPELLANGEH